MSVKAAPAAALRRLRDVLRIICKPRFLAATTLSPTPRMNHTGIPRLRKIKDVKMQ
jgi:hypothetical protein